jgi:hypothetical protein
MIVRKMLKYCFFSFVILAVFSSCSSTEHASKYQSDSIVISGVMLYLELEGGCWQFMDENGETYEIVGLNIAQLQIDGQRAEIVVREVPDVASICMVGKIVELVEIIQINDE